MQWLLCVVSVIGFVRAQEAVCGLPSARFQSREDNTPFCVVVTGDVTDANNTVEVNATYYTWFYPTVDEFTLFEIDTSAFFREFLPVCPPLLPRLHYRLGSAHTQKSCSLILHSLAWIFAIPNISKACKIFLSTVQYRHSILPLTTSIKMFIQHYVREHFFRTGAGLVHGGPGNNCTILNFWAFCPFYLKSSQRLKISGIRWADDQNHFVQNAERNSME